jgi:hypothetical protein
MNKLQILFATGVTLLATMLVVAAMWPTNGQSTIAPTPVSEDLPRATDSEADNDKAPFDLGLFDGPRLPPLVAGRGRHRPPPTPEQMQQLVRRIHRMMLTGDTNGDRLITPDEWRHTRETFDRSDLNSDGKLGFREQRRAARLYAMYLVAAGRSGDRPPPTTQPAP